MIIQVNRSKTHVEVLLPIPKLKSWKAKSGGGGREVEAVLEAFFVGRPSPF
jgi:hypothetical protein